MKFDLCSLIDVEKDKYLVEKAIYHREQNTLYITISSFEDEADIKQKLIEKLNFVKVELNFKKRKPYNLQQHRMEQMKKIHSEIDKSTKKVFKIGTSKIKEYSKSEDFINKTNEMVKIRGQIFHKELNIIKDEYFSLIFDIEDEGDFFKVKVFNRKDQSKKYEDLKEDMYVEVEGKLIYDKYISETVIEPYYIKEITVEAEKDPEMRKRIELEVHSKCTNLDGFCDLKELIEMAKYNEYEAMTITDTVCLQSLPDFYSLCKKNNIKAINGCELLLVEDEIRILTNLKEEKEIYQRDFVVFDIETTGLSKYKDKITEIGAVRIRNLQISETFSQLVNPMVFIPEKIQELTGITNDMVKDKPAIDTVLFDFLNFSKDAVLVAHNADFDIGFIRNEAKRLGLKSDFTYIDTLNLSRAILDNLKTHKLDKVSKELNISLENHHRALDDATATAKIFLKLYGNLDQSIRKDLTKINRIKTSFPKQKHESFSALVYPKSREGITDLNKLISESKIKYFHMEGKTPISLLNSLRENLLVSSGGMDGMLFKAIANDYPSWKIEEIAQLFDFYQIEPPALFEEEIRKGYIKDIKSVKDISLKIIELGKKFNKPVVATGGVRYIKPKDFILRNILHKGLTRNYYDDKPIYFYRNTSQMLDEFNYLEENLRNEIVIENTHKISEMLPMIIPIENKKYPPVIEGSDKKLRKLTYDKAYEIYGNPLPKAVVERLEIELNSIIDNGYAVLYIIAAALVKKSNEDGYLVGSRGSVGSSFAATMASITEVNPLAAHYVCPKCKYTEFADSVKYQAGIDLPDKKCPHCNTMLNKDGHDIPFEVFLGFNGDKEPDIDLNFAGEYQSSIHKYSEEFFGKEKTFRAGTISAIQSKVAEDYIRRYMEKHSLNFSKSQIKKYEKGILDVKRASGQHPGGVMVIPREYDIYKFTPIQYAADSPNSGVLTTHYTYDMLHESILKLDLLGHDVPSIIKQLERLTGVDPLKIKMDDKSVMSIFSSTKALDIKYDYSNDEIGTLGIPEFGTNFVMSMLKEVAPKKFSEMTRISGLSHGTNVWLGNAQELIKSKTAEFSEIISTRDDIMIRLIQKGVDESKAFKIMECVRKGKGLTEEQIQIMKDKDVEDWYIDSCNKISYLFPKAHAVAYCLMSYRIAYYKVYYPQAFYAAYFTNKISDFQYSTILKGLREVQNAMHEINSEKLKTAKQKQLMVVFEVAEEMHARGIEMSNASLYHSDADSFSIYDNKILPPLSAVDNVSKQMAQSIVQEREKGNFLSVEDLKRRTKINNKALEFLADNNLLDGLQQKNQISIFDTFG